MNEANELSYGEPQRASIELRRETYPGKLNVTFTRGFVASQAFVDRYGGKTPKETKQLMAALLPAKADGGLAFIPKHPKAEDALAWMGFEARSAILEVLDEAIADKKPGWARSSTILMNPVSFRVWKSLANECE